MPSSAPSEPLQILLLLKRSAGAQGGSQGRASARPRQVHLFGDRRAPQVFIPGGTSGKDSQGSGRPDGQVSAPVSWSPSGPLCLPYPPPRDLGPIMPTGTAGRTPEAMMLRRNKLLFPRLTTSGPGIQQGGRPEGWAGPPGHQGCRCRSLGASLGAQVTPFHRVAALLPGCGPWLCSYFPVGPAPGRQDVRWSSEWRPGQPLVGPAGPGGCSHPQAWPQPAPVQPSTWWTNGPRTAMHLTPRVIPKSLSSAPAHVF